MKSLFKIYAISIAMCLCVTVAMIVGCTYDEPDNINPDIRILFQPEMLMHVSHDDIDRYSTKNSFAICAWELPANTNWQNGHKDATEYLPISEARSKEVFITDTTLRDTVKDTLWAVSDRETWPDFDKNLAFMAYSPYSAGCTCSLESGITYVTDILEDQTDLLYTSPLLNKHKINDGWLVPIIFQHALCRINFKAKSRVSENEKIEVKRITLNNIHHKGVFRSLPNPYWVQDISERELPIFNGEKEIAGTPEIIGRYWLLIPQTLDTKVTVEYNYISNTGCLINHKIETIPLKTILEEGINYTFILSIGMDDVQFIKEIIEERL
ncbi:MAG: fimbrillin family protein [Bacteroidales bacterium]|nr:fimbrillin family protein [Bacteroidales bacterium]